CCNSHPSPASNMTAPPLFLSHYQPPPTSTLFPYTTLFRSGNTNAKDMHAPSETRAEIIAALCGASGTRPRRHPRAPRTGSPAERSEEHTSELQSHLNLVCRLLLEKKKKKQTNTQQHKNN